MKYYLGPWDRSAGSLLAWVPPLGTVGLVDLATLAQCAEMSDPAKRGVGFFAVDGVLDSAYTLVGDGDLREIAATVKMRQAWKSVAGINPNGDTLLDLLWDHLVSGDPDGLSASKPIMPDSTGWMDLHLGGHGRVLGERFEWGRPGSRGSDHTPKVRQALRAEFRERWQQDQDHARRCLDMACEKYGLFGDSWRDLVPADLLPNVPGRLPHATTITDNFNRTDSATLGTSSEGWSWTEVAGDTDIVSNQASCQTVGGATGSHSRAESDLSSADHYAQVDVTRAGSDDAGAGSRYSAAADTFYLADDAGSALNLYKVVGGSGYTLLGSGGITHADGTTVKSESNGSAIKAYYGGAQIVSVTDTAITGNTRTGMHGYRNGSPKPALDNFQAADFGGGGGGVLYTQLERTTRGLNRGVYTGV